MTRICGLIRDRVPGIFIPGIFRQRFFLGIIAAALLVSFTLCAPGCKWLQKKRPAVEQFTGEQAGEPFEFVRAWGTDAARGGNLSGPAALVRLDNGHLLVLDRFNARIQEYGPDDAYIGTWGRAPGGEPFSFPILVDMTRDPATGDIVVAVATRADGRSEDQAGIFLADTFLRFAPDGAFKSPRGGAEDMNRLLKNNPDLMKALNAEFWNRNEQLPFSYFGRVAVYGDAVYTTAQVAHSPVRAMAPGNQDQEEKLVDFLSEGEALEDFCEVEADERGGLYLVRCLLRLGIWRTSFEELGHGVPGLDRFIPPPVERRVKTTIDRRHNLFHHEPDNGFALYDVRGQKIFTFDSSGAEIKMIKVLPEIFYASDMVFDAQGGFYIADYVADSVLHIGADGQLLGRLGTDRTAPGQFAGRSFYLFRAGPAKGHKGRPAGVVGVTVDPEGNVYASDAHNRRVQKFGAEGRFIAEFPVCGDVPACFPADVHHANGALYIALYGTRTVLKLNPDTGEELARWKPEKPSATASCPMCGIGADARGDIFAANGESVFKLSPDLEPVPGWDPGALSIPSLQYPVDVAMDSAGDIYVAGTNVEGLLALSTKNSAVCKFSPAGRPLQCFNWGPKLHHPRSLAVSGDRLYVASSGRDTIIEAYLNGGIIQIWGGPGRVTGKFQNPLGLAADGKGNLFVADNGNERIQQFHVE